MKVIEKRSAFRIFLLLFGGLAVMYVWWEIDGNRTPTGNAYVLGSGHVRQVLKRQLQQKVLKGELPPEALSKLVIGEKEIERLMLDQDPLTADWDVLVFLPHGVGWRSYRGGVRGEPFTWTRSAASVSVGARSKPLGISGGDLFDDEGTHAQIGGWQGIWPSAANGDFSRRSPRKTAGANALNPSAIPALRWVVEINEAKTIARTEKKGVILVFFSASNTETASVRQKLFNNLQFAKYATNLVLVDLDISKHAAIAKSYRVTSAPTIVLCHDSDPLGESGAEFIGDVLSGTKELLEHIVLNGGPDP